MSSFRFAASARFPTHPCGVWVLTVALATSGCIGPLDGGGGNVDVTLNVSFADSAPSSLTAIDSLHVVTIDGSETTSAVGVKLDMSNGIDPLELSVEDGDVTFRVIVLSNNNTPLYEADTVVAITDDQAPVSVLVAPVAPVMELGRATVPIDPLTLGLVTVSNRGTGVLQFTTEPRDSTNVCPGLRPTRCFRLAPEEGTVPAGTTLTVRVGDARFPSGVFTVRFASAQGSVDVDVVTRNLSFGLVEAGGAHTCALTQSGSALCWGRDSTSQLGDGGGLAKLAPIPVVTALLFDSLSAGWSHTCGISIGLLGYCWGSNAFGQLGDGSLGDKQLPILLNRDSALVALSSGGTHSCGRPSPELSPPNLYCWGANAHGQLGDGTNDDRSRPETISITAISGVSAGETHTCAISTNGDALCWGLNSAGQLGNGSTSDTTLPTPVLGDLVFRSISAGGFHTCAVDASSDGYCWGANGNGQLGDGSNNDATTPVRLNGSFEWTSIAAGANHACGLTTEGTARCWGDNAFGQLGDGGTSNSPIPVPVAGAMTYQSITIGSNHSCGLSTDGRVYCWGRNDDGRLGDGTTTSRNSPTAVLGQQ